MVDLDQPPINSHTHIRQSTETVKYVAAKYQTR